MLYNAKTAKEKREAKKEMEKYGLEMFCFVKEKTRIKLLRKIYKISTAYYVNRKIRMLEREMQEAKAYLCASCNYYSKIKDNDFGYCDKNKKKVNNVDKMCLFYERNYEKFIKIIAM